MVMMMMMMMMMMMLMMMTGAGPGVMLMRWGVQDQAVRTRRAALQQSRRCSRRRRLALWTTLRLRLKLTPSPRQPARQG